MPIGTLPPFNANQKVFTETESLSLLLVLFNAYIVRQDIWNWGNDRPVVEARSGTPKLPMVQMIVAAGEFDAALERLVYHSEVVAVFHHPELDKSVQPQSNNSRVLMALMRTEESARRMVGML